MSRVISFSGGGRRKNVSRSSLDWKFFNDRSRDWRPEAPRHHSAVMLDRFQEVSQLAIQCPRCQETPDSQTTVQCTCDRCSFSSPCSSLIWILYVSSRNFRGLDWINKNDQTYNFEKDWRLSTSCVANCGHPLKPLRPSYNYHTKLFKGCPQLVPYCAERCEILKQRRCEIFSSRAGWIVYTRATLELSHIAGLFARQTKTKPQRYIYPAVRCSSTKYATLFLYKYIWCIYIYI